MIGGTRFLDRWRPQIEASERQARFTTTTKGSSPYPFYRMMLDSPQCKRLLFDGRQVELFAELDEGPPPHIQSMLHPPFPTFYMEFSDPIRMPVNQPGYENDYLRAFMVWPASGDFEKPQGQSIWVNGKPYESTLYRVCAVLHDPGGPGRPESFIDRTFTYDLANGITLVRLIDCLYDDVKQEGQDTLSPDASTGFPDEWIARARETDAQTSGYLGNQWQTQLSQQYTFAGYPVQQGWQEGEALDEKAGRHVGWWERQCMDCGELLSWCLTYMMAKSVTIVEQALPRQQRRWLERHGKLPKPWHIVKVEPKLVFTHGQQGEPDLFRHVNHRFDVIGHLRFNKHHTRDGLKYTVEWVPPHQRGLANELYIPKTYKVERGKTIDPAMREAWGVQSAAKLEQLSEDAT